LESSSLQLKKTRATGDFGIVGMAIVSAFATTLAKKKRALVQSVRPFKQQEIWVSYPYFLLFFYVN
jgi:hypothetical protein